MNPVQQLVTRRWWRGMPRGPLSPCTLTPTLTPTTYPNNPYPYLPPPRPLPLTRYNAVFSVREKGSLGYAEWDSFYVLRGSPYFDGNAGAGSTTIGYQFATWDNGADRFYNNSGHAIGQVGASFLGGVITPVTDLTLWMVEIAIRTLTLTTDPNPDPNPDPDPNPHPDPSPNPNQVEIAVWGYAKTDTPVFGPGLRLADFKKGFVWGFIGADSEEHTVRMQTLSIVDSLMVGRAKSNTYCSAGVGVGIMLAIAGTKGFSISPETCGPLGGHWTRGIYGPESPTGSAPALAAETRVRGVTLHDFGETSCGKTRVMQPLMKGDGVTDPLTLTLTLPLPLTLTLTPNPNLNPNQV